MTVSVCQGGGGGGGRGETEREGGGGGGHERVRFTIRWRTAFNLSRTP